MRSWVFAVQYTHMDAQAVMGDDSSVMRLECWGDVALAKYGMLQQFDVQNSFAILEISNIEVGLMSKNGALKVLQLDATTTFKKLPGTAPPSLSGMVKSSACLLSFGGLTGFQRPFFACLCGTVTAVSELRMTKATGTPMVELQVADQHGCSLPLNVLGEWAYAGYSEGHGWVFCFAEAKSDESRKSELLCWVYDSAYVFQAPLESAPEAEE